MGIVSQGFKTTLKRQDHTGNQSTITFQLTSIDMISALADAIQVKDYYEAVSDMALLSYDVAEQFINDVFVEPPYSAQREVVAVITGKDELVPRKIHTINIIGANEAVFQSDLPKEVDFTNIAVANFFNMASTAGEITISDGEKFKDDGWTGGKRTSRRNSDG